MGSNNGTGQPITFGCTKCRRQRHRNFDGVSRAVISPVWRTGRVKPLSRQQEGYGGRRVAQENYEYKCRVCGFVGWSRHKDVARAALLPETT